MTKSSVNRHSLLLDTHVFLWWRTAPDRLSKEALRSIATAPRVCVSVASAWEASIKIALGRLRLPEPFSVGVHDSGFEPLLVRFEHTERLKSLPLLHRDPFDRMLVVQAIVDGLTLVTRDRAVEPYEVDTLWV